MGWVKSSVTVGHVAEGEKEAKAEETEEEKSRVLNTVVLPCCKVVAEPGERNMLSADDVKLAIGLAAGGSGWLWFPS